jgi:predicted transposase/invertase (TIGR01784 family)
MASATGIRRYEVKESVPGIYTVKGDYLPIQIIETKKLSGEENLWLKSLSNDLESSAAKAILKVGKEMIREAQLSAYLDVLLRANPQTFLEAWKMADSTATFEEVFTEAGIIPQWIERGVEQGIERGKFAIARNLLARGWAIEEIAETTELPVEKIRSLSLD